MKPAKLIIFGALLLAANWSIAHAQTLSSLRDNRTPAAPVSVTFTFPPSGGDYSTFPDEENKDRYYIRVASSSLPSYTVSPSTASVRVMVDNEKSDHASLVFWIPVVAGTSPRVDRNQSTLTLTFTPASTSRASAPTIESGGPSAMRALSEPGTPAASLVSSVANPANSAPQATPTPGSLTSLLPQFKADNNLLAVANVDLAVPESPAFTVLGLTPEMVVRPNSPRQFATALLSGVDRNGNFQSGTAIDTVPYLLLAGKELTLKQYQDHYKIRLLSRTQFSFATTKGASEDDKSVRLSLGLRLTLWDNGDPRTDKDLLDCFDSASVKYLQALVVPPVAPLELLPPTASEEDKNESIRLWAAYELKEAQANPTRLEETEACRVEARKRNWNKSSWIVAYAPSWISTSGQTKNFKWNGGGFWSSVAYGFEGFPVLAKRSQIIFHGRYRSNEQVPDPAIQGAFLSQDSLFFGTRVRVGNENSTGSFEGVFVRSRHDANAWDTSARYAVGFERRVAENLWFALAFGGENGRANGNNKGFVLTSFRWGFSEKRPLPAPK